MTTWVFNEGTSAHRGVWHAATAPIEYETIPADTRDWDSNLYGKHAKGCPLARRDYYVEGRGTSNPRPYIHEGSETYYSRPKKYIECDCGLGYPGIIGKYTLHHVYPEHKQMKTVSVLCNQVRISARSWPDFPDSKVLSKDAKPGDVVTLTANYNERGFIYEGDLPPGPVCSRCRKKAALNG